MEKKQIDCFKAHFWRQQLEADTNKYRYKIGYNEDPNSLPLLDNYQASYLRHEYLRKSFDPVALAEFTESRGGGNRKKIQSSQNLAW